MIWFKSDVNWNWKSFLNKARTFEQSFGAGSAADGGGARRPSIFSSTFPIKLCEGTGLHRCRLHFRQKINKVWITKTKLWSVRSKIMKISSFIEFYWKLSLKNVNFKNIFLFSKKRHLMRPLKAFSHEEIWIFVLNSELSTPTN